MDNRKAFNFFRSYWETASKMEDSDRLKFYDALLNKQFKNEEPNLDGIADLVYTSQKHSIDAQVEGYLSKIKAIKQKPHKGASVGGSKGASVQEKEKEKEQVQEKEKLEWKEKRERFKTEFYNSVLEQLKLGNITKEEARKFYDYWTEHGDNDRKVRFQKEKSFSIKRRVGTWMSKVKENPSTNNNQSNRLSFSIK